MKHNFWYYLCEELGKQPSYLVLIIFLLISFVKAGIQIVFGCLKED